MRIAAGTSLVQAAGQSMEEIVMAVSRVTETIGEISVATTEQSAGLSPVNDAVLVLDHMTQQNAAQVEESNAAESLRDQAGRLRRFVGTFRAGMAATEALEHTGGDRGDPVCTQV